MGERARKARVETQRTIRTTRLTPDEKAFLKESAFYEGSRDHKRNPGDFGLEPPMNPRKDKTLCDDAGVFAKSVAIDLLARAIEGGLVSEAFTGTGFPKQLWVVHEGRVYEAIYGGSRTGSYHGYPIRSVDPLFDKVLESWSAR